MPLSDDYDLVACVDIIVPDNRQRRVLKDGQLSELARTIREVGVIHPIVITRKNLLVTGECRLKACRDILKHINIPARYVDEADEGELAALEFIENNRRVDLPWKDKVQAVAAYHKLMSDRNPGWDSNMTAIAFGISRDYASENLQIARELEAGNENVIAATTQTAAINSIQREFSRSVDFELDNLDSVLELDADVYKGDVDEERRPLATRAASQDIHTG
ncbi:hypothetical protein LCGC14_2417240, partial [marine sediment metagenome]